MSVRFISSLLELNPGIWRWRLGAEVGVAMSLVIGAWTLTGRQPAGLVASLGVFTILYGAGWSRDERVRALPAFGLAIVAASATGVLCASGPVSGALGLVTVAAVATAVTLRFGIGPPGPLMFVLVCGVSGYLSGLAMTTGLPVPRQEIPAFVASGSLLAYAVVAAPWLVSRLLGRPSRSPARRLDELMPASPLPPESVLLAVRLVAAAALAAWVGTRLGSERVYWIVVPAVAVLQKSHASHITVGRAVHRILGTVIGLGVFALAHRVASGPLGIVMLTAAFQGAAEVVVTRNYALGLMLVTPVALIIAASAPAADAGLVTQTRLFDTLWGAGAALLVLGMSRVLPVRRVRDLA